MSGPITAGVRGQAYVALQGIRGWPLGRFVRQLRAWERLPVEEFQRLQRARLRETLARAKETVPRYAQGAWAGARADSIDGWPVLEREALLRHHGDLLAQPAPANTVVRKTSGSSGERARIVLTKDAEAWGWAHRYRALLWHGLPIGVQTLRLTHHPHALRDWLLARHSVKALESDAAIDRALDILQHRRPPLVAGPPSTLFYLARRLRERGVDRPLAPFARVGGEQLFRFQRAEIQACLAARAIDSYGATEIGSIASECPEGSLHVYAEHVYLEVFDGDKRLEPGEPGDLVATPLNNPAMPLVRYRVGDGGRLSPEPCRCGLPHPVLLDLQARAADRYTAANGTEGHAAELIERVGQSFAETPGVFVRQFQLVQRGPVSWRACVQISGMPSTPDGAAFSQRLERQLRDVLGDAVRTEVEFVPALPRAVGKLRYFRRESPAAA